MGGVNFMGAKTREISLSTRRAKHQGILGFLGKRNWVLITKDNTIRKNNIERNVLNNSNVRAFFMTAKGRTGKAQADVIANALPTMLRLLRRTHPPFIARITAHSSVNLIKK